MISSAYNKQQMCVCHQGRLRNLVNSTPGLSHYQTDRKGSRTGCPPNIHWNQPVREQFSFTEALFSFTVLQRLYNLAFTELLNVSSSLFTNNVYNNESLLT